MTDNCQGALGNHKHLLQSQQPHFTNPLRWHAAGVGNCQFTCWHRWIHLWVEGRAFITHCCVKIETGMLLTGDVSWQWWVRRVGKKSPIPYPDLFHSAAWWTSETISVRSLRVRVSTRQAAGADVEDLYTQSLIAFWINLQTRLLQKGLSPGEKCAHFIGQFHAFMNLLL